MSQLEILDNRLSGAVWRVSLRDPLSIEPPQILVHADGRELSSPRMEWISAIKAWGMTVQMPVELISDGVHTMSLTDGRTGEVILSLPLLFGSALGEDDRTELARLRSEVDLIKRVIRSQFRSEQESFKFHLPEGARIHYADGAIEDANN